MAQKNKTARPAARKQSHTKTKKTVATRSASSRREPIAQVVDRSQPRQVVEQPKMKGELPVPQATFYF